MGRWGKGIYQSDSALDYFSTITDRIEREFAFQFSPDQAKPEAWWLMKVIDLAEVTLLLFQHCKVNILYESSVETVQRWQHIFFKIWDADLELDQHTKTPLDNNNYRKEKRPLVAKLFSQVESIAQGWADLKYEIDYEDLLTPSSPNAFSQLKDENNKPFFYNIRFPSDLVSQLVKDIIYYLASETRWEAFGFFSLHEEIPVAIDILGALCEALQISPNVKHKDIKIWRATTMEIIRQTAHEYEIKDNSEQYANIETAFDRLEAVAQKYPQFDWGI